MKAFVGTVRLVRLVLRRDRIRLPAWIVSLVGLVGFSATQVKSLYGTPATISGYVSTASGNPALVMFSGPGYGFDRPTVGAILVNETSLWMAVGCALMSVFLVVRHTRAEEENERADLLRSAVVGRHAPLAAAVVVVVAADVLVAGASAVVIIAGGFPVAGSIALAASFGLVGICFAAVAAIAAQIGNTARGALGLGAAAIAATFVLRGIGDVSVPALSWLTPFGWGIGIRAYAAERWWTLAGLLVASLTLVATAAAVSDRRDLGSGLVPQHGGRGRAAPWITHPLGLALRLQRASIIAWCVGVFTTGLMYGWVGRDVEAMLADNPQLADYLAQLSGASVGDAYLATAIGIMAMVTGGYALSSALRTRSEEAAGFAESMLATPTSRVWWAGSHVVVTVLGAIAVTACSALGTGVGYAIGVDDGTQVLRLVAAGMATLPAVLVLVGIAVALFGWLPRSTTLAWSALALVVVVGLFGTVLRLPHWVRMISPFEHGARLPAQAFEVAPAAVLTGLAITLVAFGLGGFRRRDLASA